jgi:hypothetical protein
VDNVAGFSRKFGRGRVNDGWEGTGEELSSSSFGQSLKLEAALQHDGSSIQFMVELGRWVGANDTDDAEI